MPQIFEIARTQIYNSGPLALALNMQKPFVESQLYTLLSLALTQFLLKPKLYLFTYSVIQREFYNVLCRLKSNFDNNWSGS